MENPYEFVQPESRLEIPEAPNSRDSQDRLSRIGAPTLGETLERIHKIKVLGIGGCGNNSITYMIESGLIGPEYIAANSDLQDLARCLAPKKIQLGVKLAKGLGCGGKPEIGREATAEDLDKVKEALTGADLVFLTVGLGGGTGSGGAPLVAEMLSRMDNPPLVVAVVTTPFGHERNRHAVAEAVIKELTPICNSIITVPNAALMKIYPNTGWTEALEISNSVLFRAVSAITELIDKSGTMNVDFSDIKSTLSCRGPAIIGIGEATGEKRAQMALKAATSSPLLGGLSIKGAKRILVNITCGPGIGLSEFDYVSNAAVEEADAGVEVFTGVVEDPALTESGLFKVTLIATGLCQEEEEWPTSGMDSKPDLILLEEEPELVTSEVYDSARGVPTVKLIPPVGRGLFQDPGPSGGPNSQQGPANQDSGQAKPENQGGGRAPMPRVPLGNGQEAGQGNISRVNKYERNSGVDPVNANPRYYDIPPAKRGIFKK